MVCLCMPEADRMMPVLNGVLNRQAGLYLLLCKTARWLAELTRTLHALLHVCWCKAGVCSLACITLSTASLPSSSYCCSSHVLCSESHTSKRQQHIHILEICRQEHTCSFCSASSLSCIFCCSSAVFCSAILFSSTACCTSASF